MHTQPAQTVQAAFLQTQNAVAITVDATTYTLTPAQLQAFKRELLRADAQLYLRGADAFLTATAAHHADFPKRRHDDPV
jgi:hypothetical protein